MSGSSTTSKGSIFLGEVASVQAYGAFIKIPGSSSQGLVHRTQISKVNVPDVSEVLNKGDRVWCKVISDDDGKIGLSMKHVDQGSGHDLDPNGVQMQLDEQRRKEWVPGSKQKTISLEAVYNTTCSKCGTRGHLGKDCFQVMGGKTYELIPEDDLQTAHTSKDLEMSEESKKKLERKQRKKEEKREKKEAKKIKKAAKKLKKKMKKEAKKAMKKTKKKKKQHSSSDTDDSLSSSSSSSSCDSKHGGFESKSGKQNAATSYPQRRSRSQSPARQVKRYRNDSGPFYDRDTSPEKRRGPRQ